MDVHLNVCPTLGGSKHVSMSVPHNVVQEPNSQYSSIGQWSIHSHHNLVELSLKVTQEVGHLLVIVIRSQIKPCKLETHARQHFLRRATFVEHSHPFLPQGVNQALCFAVQRLLVAADVQRDWFHIGKMNPDVMLALAWHESIVATVKDTQALDIVILSCFLLSVQL